MDPPGIAPGSPACDTGVFLLDDEPVLCSFSKRFGEKGSNLRYLVQSQGAYR